MSLVTFKIFLLVAASHGLCFVATSRDMVVSVAAEERMPSGQATAVDSVCQPSKGGCSSSCYGSGKTP